MREPEQADKMLNQLKAWRADTQQTATPQPGGWEQSSKTGEEWHTLFMNFMKDRQNSY
jgi:hypothetical protein